MWRFRTFSEAWPLLSCVCLSRLWGPAHTKPRLIFPPYPTSPDTGSRPPCPPPFPAFSGRDRLPSLIQVRCLSSSSLSRLSKHLSHGFLPRGGSSRRSINMFFPITPHCSLTSLEVWLSEWLLSPEIAFSQVHQGKVRLALMALHWFTCNPKNTESILLIVSGNYSQHLWNNLPK